MRHDHLHSSLEEGRKMAMVILPFSLGRGRAGLLFLLRICHDHLRSSLLRYGRR
jgi:hypothetical protein